MRSILLVLNLLKRAATTSGTPPLPEYSPELNLIEILWRFMKYEWIEFWAYTSLDRLVQYVEGVIQGFEDKYKINFG
jgi:transposase